MSQTNCKSKWLRAVWKSGLRCVEMVTQLFEHETVVKNTWGLLFRQRFDEVFKILLNPLSNMITPQGRNLLPLFILPLEGNQDVPPLNKSLWQGYVKRKNYTLGKCIWNNSKKKQNKNKLILTMISSNFTVNPRLCQVCFVPLACCSNEALMSVFRPGSTSGCLRRWLV